MKNWDKITAELIREEEEKDGQPIEPPKNATYADVRESAFSLMKTLAPYMSEDGMDDAQRKIQSSLIESGKELQMMKEEWEKKELADLMTKADQEMAALSKEKGWSEPDRQGREKMEQSEERDETSTSSCPEFEQEGREGKEEGGAHEGGVLV